MGVKDKDDHKPGLKPSGWYLLKNAASMLNSFYPNYDFLRSCPFHPTYDFLRAVGLQINEGTPTRLPMTLQMLCIHVYWRGMFPVFTHTILFWLPLEFSGDLVSLVR